MTGDTVPPLAETRNRGIRSVWTMMGLRSRLIFYMLVALLALLVGFSILSFQAVNQAQRQAFSQEIRLARSLAVDLEREFNHIASDVHVYLPSVPSAVTAAESMAFLHDHLANLENLRYFRVIGVRLIGANGRVVAAAPPDIPVLQETLPDEEIIRLSLSEGTTQITPSHLRMGEEEPFATITIPMSRSSDSLSRAVLVVDTVGLTALDIFLSTRETAAKQDDEGRYEFEVISTDGRVLTTTGGDDILGDASYHYAAMRTFMEQRKAGAIVHKSDEHPDHIAAIVPLQGAPFFLITEEPLGLLLDWPRQLRDQALIMGSVAVFIILAMGWVVTRQIVQPLFALRKATARIKGGDLDTPVSVPAQGEMAQLVEGVEDMRQQLRDMVSSLDDVNKSLADQVRERTRQLQAVVGRLMQAQEDERRRLARDLHDETAQSLTALGLLLDAAALDVMEGGTNSLGSIREAREQVRRLVAETRRLAYALRPSVLDDAGLVPALRWCAEAYLEPSEVEVSLHAPEPELRCPEPVEVALFRVGQEAMSNIARHAHASHTWVSLERLGACVKLTVRDDGVGFDVDRTMVGNGLSQVRGFGLTGMRERIDILGGRLDVSSWPGNGTTVTACVPTEGSGEERP